MPWVSQALLVMVSWQGADSSGGAPEANATLSSQRYNNILGENGSDLPSDGGRGMVMDAVTPATHAPAGGEADAAAGPGNRGVPSNDEARTGRAPGGGEEASTVGCLPSSP